MKKIITFSIIFIFIFNSCAKNVNNEVEVYSNDFEGSLLTSITNGSIYSFAGTKVLGTYSNGGFGLALNNLPEHDLVDVSFDLYVHDNWVGNQNTSYNETSPDIWELKVNGKTFISTTFSNQDCVFGNICPPQSYPADYPNNNQNPKFGATRTDFPGVCSKLNNPAGSTLYKIHKSISHAEKTLLLQCLDEFTQRNVVDNKCNASWSIDNLKIKVISLH